jgi:hypothetical protein
MRPNRVLLWEVDGPNYYRSSELQLDGAAAPRSYVFLVRDLPAGQFEIRATVGAAGTIARRWIEATSRSSDLRNFRYRLDLGHFTRIIGEVRIFRYSGLACS